MAINDLFSKRQKILNGEVSDIYEYEDIPYHLRVQIVHIIQDTLGAGRTTAGENIVEMAYSFIHKALCREYGKFTLYEKYSSHEKKLLNFFLETDDYEEAIDVIEFTFNVIDKKFRASFNIDSFVNNVETLIKPDEAIVELNARFKEHAIGYQFEGGRIIRIDSEYTHAEIVKPVLALLLDDKFKGANEEYLSAHEHYRNGKNKECLTDCLKAFESTMKIICNEKGWKYKEKDTSKALIQICFDNELVPVFTQNQFTALRNIIESGVPTIRNRQGGHGQGQVPQKVDDEMTRYTLNLTGSNIIFLIEQSKIS